MLYLDLKYLHFVQNKIPGFVRKKDNLFNGRCPICGDSSSNQNKKRFFVYAWKDSLLCKCHKCDYSSSFGKFLEHFDPFLYSQYRVELFKEKYGSRSEAAPIPTEPPKIIPTTPMGKFLELCPNLTTLPISNAAVQYCIGRKIPRPAWANLHYIDDTTKLITLSPELKISRPEKRLVLPFIDKDKNLIGMTCRSLDQEASLRYLTVKLSDSPMVFGMNTVDPTKPIFIVEGPIDSLFLPNAIAVTGTSFGKVEGILKGLNLARDQVTLIIDNQPRNRAIVDILDKLITNGFNVVIWDLPAHDGKDVNDLIKNGKSVADVVQAIRRSTFRGLEAKMKFIQWKKC